MSKSNLETKIKDYYDAHNRKHLRKKFREASETMMRIMLLGTLYQALFNENLHISAESKDHVRQVRQELEESEFVKVAPRIDESLEKLRDELEKARDSFRSAMHDLEERITGFQSLNRHISRVAPDKIQNLLSRLQNIDRDVVNLDEKMTFDEKREEAEQMGKQMQQEIESIEDELFYPFRNLDIADLVRGLIRGNNITLKDLSSDELVQLKESSLSAYVNLVLEGEGEKSR
jgi:hypothetical protein